MSIEPVNTSVLFIEATQLLASVTCTVQFPAHSAVTDEAVVLLHHKYVYPLTPPDTIAVEVPSQFPTHVTFVVCRLTAKAAGSRMVMFNVDIQLFPSVTVIT